MWEAHFRLLCRGDEAILTSQFCQVQSYSFLIKGFTIFRANHVKGALGRECSVNSRSVHRVRRLQNYRVRGCFLAGEEERPRNFGRT